MHHLLHRLRRVLGAQLIGFSTLASGTVVNAQTLPVLQVTRLVVVEGDQLQVSRVWRGGVGPTGAIYLVVNNERQMLTFGPDGQKRTALGRDGEGPGDYRSMRNIGFIGDTLWVGDPVLRRATLYTADDRLIGTRRIEKLVIPAGLPLKLPKLNAVIPQTIFGDGSMLVMALAYGMYFDAPDAPTRGIPLLKVSSKGVVEKQVGWIPVSHELAGPPNNPGKWLYPAFDNRPAHAFSGDGALFVTAIASNLNEIVPTAQISVLRTSGDTVYTRSVPVATPTIPDSILDREYRKIDPRDSKEQAEFRRTRPRPKYYPPLKDVFISTSGWVLVAFTSDVEHYYGATRNAASEREYVLLDGVGKPVGSFKLPARTTVLQLNDNAIWAVDFDRDDVPTVVRYRIRWRM